MSYQDAHNHLQDTRFAGRQADLMRTADSEGITAMVVNGSCLEDWPSVAALAAAHPQLWPSFGWHPWYLHQMDTFWLDSLRDILRAHPSAAIGEIGLDRWILEQPIEVRARHQPDFQNREPTSLADQTKILVAQLDLAQELARPVTIHCLRAWGPLLDILRHRPLPDRGFLLHSYGGSAELVPELTSLGAYFSFPGYFALERKARQREVFRSVPLDRLLVETDAPDQLPPESLIRYPLADSPAGGKPLNHPANLPAIYEYLADWLGIPRSEFEERISANFHRWLNDSIRS